MINIPGSEAFVKIEQLNKGWDYTHYFAYGALFALRAPRWAGFNNIEEGKRVTRDILKWSDNLKNPIPAWYMDNKYELKKLLEIIQ